MPLSVHKRVSVVVDMGFAQMLGLGSLVRLVVMVDRGVAVLVIVSGHHVLPVRPVTMVVNDVSVLVTMHGWRHDDASPLFLHLLSGRPSLRSQCSQVRGPPTESKVMPG